MSLSDYSQLVQLVEYNVGSSERHRILLDELKEFYRDDINSPRRYEQIKTIGDLLRILELRDVLSDENVSTLKVIARKLNNDQLMREINSYESCYKSRGPYNYFGVSGNQGTSAHNHLFEQPARHNNLNSGVSQMKMNRIVGTIVDEIGEFWRDLGRYLKIQEGVIEDIDEEYPTLVSKATKLLEVYELKKKDPDRWYFQLCEALEKSRRKDLSKSIKEIMLMNI